MSSFFQELFVYVSFAINKGSIWTNTFLFLTLFWSHSTTENNRKKGKVILFYHKEFVLIKFSGYSI
jgi:hypothetical protein